MDLFRNLTVLSLEQALVLPYLTYRLAHDGMKIIRMEHPVYGDPNRLVGENVLGEERMNSYYLCVNAGKKAVTLNLAEQAGQEIFRSLIQKLKVDIFATNQLPRNYKKLGIDYESLKAMKEDIIAMLTKASFVLMCVALSIGAVIILGAMWKGKRAVSTPALEEAGTVSELATH